MLWMLLTLGVVCIFSMQSCKSGQGVFGWLQSGPPAPKPGHTPATGTSETFHTIRWMATFSFVPGLLLTVASVWVPILRSIGVTLLAIGIGLAIVPWFLADYAPYFIWAGLGVAVAYIGWKGYDLWDYRKRRRVLSESLSNPTNSHEQQVQIMAQIESLDALYGVKTKFVL